MSIVQSIQYNISSNSYLETAFITIGSEEIQFKYSIKCPNEDTDVNIHHIKRNGSDKKFLQPKQQYLCKTCGKSFYAHTSKFVMDLEDLAKNQICKALKDSCLNAKDFFHNLGISRQTATRIIQKILKQIQEIQIPVNQEVKKEKDFTLMIMDETFITIDKKTYYLIAGIRNWNEIEVFALVEHRTVEIIYSLIKSFEDITKKKLGVLVSDGFRGYQGAVYRLDHDIIHVRHIHKPPYGRLSIESYKIEPQKVLVQVIETQNDILNYEGPFLAQISSKIKPRFGPKKRGRKAGGKNRPKEVIIAEKEEKKISNGKRGRPLGTQTQRKKKYETVFYHHLSFGLVTCYHENDIQYLKIFHRLCKYFSGKYITTNMIEGEWSALKSMFNFRGRRDLKQWNLLINGLVQIQKDKNVLINAVKLISISPQLINQIIPKLVKVGGLRY